MAVAVLDSRQADNISFARWRHGAGEIVLWSAILLLVVYPLLMVVAAVFSPAFPDSPPLKLSDLLGERLFTASINTLRLGISVG
jgi:ABC-type Fe3+ transport system permease subunit